MSPTRFDLPAFGGSRTVRVWCPEGDRPRPVLYMHDGQNLFREDAAPDRCWEVGEAVRALDLDLIVVGIDSAPGSRRLDELSPWKSERGGGDAEAYFDLIVRELKPRIDSKFPTLSGRGSTFLAGSSLGGLASLYGACRHPGVFSRAACFSSSFWFAPASLAEFLSGAALPDRVYLDVGTAEGDANDQVQQINGALRVYDQLAGRGLGPDRLKLVIDQGGQHNEAAWAHRLPGALRWWLSDLVRDSELLL